MQSIHVQKPTIEKYHHILIIEDNVTTALHLKNLLKKLGFVNIKHSNSGQKGLEESLKIIIHA